MKLPAFSEQDLEDVRTHVRINLLDNLLSVLYARSFKDQPEKVRDLMAIFRNSATPQSQGRDGELHAIVSRLTGELVDDFEQRVLRLMTERPPV